MAFDMAEVAIQTTSATAPGNAHSGGPSRGIDQVPAEALFLASAIAQYAGAVIAKKLFDEVDASTVAFFRVAWGGVVVVAISRAWKRSWSRTDLKAAALFGIATACMNLFFYLAIDRIDLGVGVAIEFLGPISVAAAKTRSTRNWVALLFAVVGVLVLAGLELNGGDPIGLIFMLGASACWAAYIVLGSRASTTDRGLSTLGVGLLIGSVAILPFGRVDLLNVMTHAPFMLRCFAVGVLSSAIGYSIDQRVLKRMSTRRFALMLALLPVVAVIAGTLFLGERPGWIDGLGMLLVLVGLIIQERSS
jgi:inner membrane transporter RhtA